MISKFNLSALGMEGLRPIKPSYLRNEKEKSNEKNEDDKELNRYVLSRIICKLLNDYSDGPDFVQEDHNFSTLKSLTEDDWTDLLKKIEEQLNEKYDAIIQIEIDYDWIKEDGREIKAFVDKVWKLIDGEDDSDTTDTSKDEEKKSEEHIIYWNTKSKKDDTEEDDDSESDSDDEDSDKDDSDEDDKDDDSDDDSNSDDEEDEDDDKEDSKSKDKDDKESDDDEEDDDKSDKKSKSKKDESDEDSEEDGDEDDDSEKSEEFLGGLFGGQTPSGRIKKYTERYTRIKQAMSDVDNDTGSVSYPLIVDKCWVYNPDDDNMPINVPPMRVTLDYLGKVNKATALFVNKLASKNISAAQLAEIGSQVTKIFGVSVEYTDGRFKDNYLEPYSRTVTWPNADWYKCTRTRGIPDSVIEGYTTLGKALSTLTKLHGVTKQDRSYAMVDALTIWFGKVFDQFVHIIQVLCEYTPVVHKESPEADNLNQAARTRMITNINKNIASKYNITSWDSSTIYQDLHKLEVYHNYVRSLDLASTEGIGTGLLKIFIGVTDVFLKIGNTFKTNIFKFYKDLKRSEMRYYYESHTTMCLKAESVPITQVTNIDVPIPSGMKGPYQNACMSLEQVYTVLDIQAYGQGVLSALIDFRRKLMRSEDYKNTLVPMTNLVKQRESSLNLLKSSVDKVFTEQRTPLEVKFTSVYKTMKEFKDIRLALLDMEKYLAATNSLVKLVDDIDTVLADITSYLTEDQEIDKGLITDMINIVKYMGVSFDIYGTTTTRQMAVEHNHIGAIGRVWSTIH